MRLRGGVTGAAGAAAPGRPGTVPRGPVLVGGVGYRWAGDASFGLVVADRLAERSWPPGVTVEDLGYGALFVAQDLAAARPSYARLVLLAATERGRAPGTVQRTAWNPEPAAPEEVQARIVEAGAGVVDLDHLLVIAHHFGALPPEVVLFELEPVGRAGGAELSADARDRLQGVEAAVVREVVAPAAPGPGPREPLSEGGGAWNAPLRS